MIHFSATLRADHFGLFHNSDWWLAHHRDLLCDSKSRITAERFRAHSGAPCSSRLARLETCPCASRVLRGLSYSRLDRKGLARPRSFRPRILSQDQVLVTQEACSQ